MAEYVTNQLQKIRLKKNMTQEELGKVVGVTRQTIIAMEKGNYTPSVLLALKIAKTLKMKVEDIFSL